jgi:hypothetical protein
VKRRMTTTDARTFTRRCAGSGAGSSRIGSSACSATAMLRPRPPRPGGGKGAGRSGSGVGRAAAAAGLAADGTAARVSAATGPTVVKSGRFRTRCMPNRPTVGIDRRSNARRRRGSLRAAGTKERSGKTRSLRICRAAEQYELRKDTGIGGCHPLSTDHASRLMIGRRGADWSKVCGSRQDEQRAACAAREPK